MEIKTLFTKKINELDIKSFSFGNNFRNMTKEEQQIEAKKIRQLKAEIENIFKESIK